MRPRPRSVPLSACPTARTRACSPDTASPSPTADTSASHEQAQAEVGRPKGRCTPHARAMLRAARHRHRHDRPGMARLRVLHPRTTNVDRSGVQGPEAGSRKPIPSKPSWESSAFSPPSPEPSAGSRARSRPSLPSSHFKRQRRDGFLRSNPSLRHSWLTSSQQRQPPRCPTSTPSRRGSSQEAEHFDDTLRRVGPRRNGLSQRRHCGQKNAVRNPDPLHPTAWHWYYLQRGEPNRKFLGVVESP